MNENHSMTEKEMQFMAVSIIWFGFVILMVALFIAAGLQGAFVLPHYIFAGFILALALFGTGMVVRWIWQTNDVTKAKRERIDMMLRDMSDNELFELKQRLMDGTVTDDTLLDYVSDDGELVFQR